MKFLEECAFTWSEAKNKISFAKNLPTALRGLNSMRPKIVAPNISLNMIITAYKENKYEGLLQILVKDENGTIRVTKNRKVI